MRYDTQRDYDDRSQDYHDRSRLETEERPDAEGRYDADDRLDTQDAPDGTEPVDAPHELAQPAVTSQSPEPVEPAEPEPAVGAAPVPPPAVTATGDDIATLWPEDTVRDMQERFREVQWRFVDDPRGAADEAHALVTEALDQFSATVESRKRELDGWRDADGGDGDTEQMRMVVRRYRALLDRLLAA